MNCNKCTTGLPIGPIRDPSDLRRAIGGADEAVRAGLLTYVGAGQLADPFRDLITHGYWGDFVSNYFSCTACGQLFRLHAETYHGAGGAFEPVDGIREPLQERE